MRKILFRGKRKDNGEWVYGMPLFDWADCSLKCKNQHNGELYLFLGWNDMCHEYEEYDVDPKSVGQYTEIDDKNRNMIFENDIVEYDNDKSTIGVVKHIQGTFDSGIYKYNGWVIVEKYGNIDRSPLLGVEKDSIFNKEYGEFVLGNIFDDPELMER